MPQGSARPGLALTRPAIGWTSRAGGIVQDRGEGREGGRLYTGRSGLTGWRTRGCGGEAAGVPGVSDAGGGVGAVRGDDRSGGGGVLRAGGGAGAAGAGAAGDGGGDRGLGVRGADGDRGG